MEFDSGYYLMGTLGTSMGVVFGIARDLAANRLDPGLMPKIARVTGSFIVGWTMFWWLCEKGYSIGFAGGCAAMAGAIGLNLVALFAYVLIVSIETKAKIPIPERAKDFFESLSK